ncbi:MAG: mechanosensitive ion channel [Oscillatoriales cyanobacterium C42_A2020_001]|nr:mechanosensitive ion channel [Leptolyngbyaceae cyanobacterium C42_A2020_001]
MQWLFSQLQAFFKQLGAIFSTPIFEIGGTQYSANLIATLILVLIGVFWIAHFLSNLIKRGLLARLIPERGSREVVAAFVRYSLTFVGIVVVLQSAGVNLSSLTIFAGVLGIGIGFGLQNLASNFISGLTILLEQPIRVGDFIQVNDLLGTVEDISIRSTTVRTQDGVFVIVPNIKFVENHVVNWSYRDPRCRIHIPVSVEYGSDAVLISEALLEAARKEPRVLSDPVPRVWFRQFGESSLNFELLVWIDKPAENEPIKSSLNFLINQSFRSRGIEMPFPQRELYIRNLGELTPLLRSHDDGAASTNNKTPPPESDLAQLDKRKTNPTTLNNLALRNLLRRISYFEQCSDIEILQLIEYGYRQIYPAEQIVCEEGEPGDSFYIILKGSVEIFSRRVEQYIATLNEGEFFGEMSLLMGIPRSATVRTREDSVLFVIERSDLQRLLGNHRDLADQIAQKLVERQQMLQDMGILSAFSEETPLLRIRKRLQTLFGI